MFAPIIIYFAITQMDLFIQGHIINVPLLDSDYITLCRLSLIFRSDWVVCLLVHSYLSIVTCLSVVCICYLCMFTGEQWSCRASAATGWGHEQRDTKGRGRVLF